MKPVAVLPPDAPIVEAAKLMKTEEVGIVPVGSADQIQGVVTPHEIAVSAVAEGCAVETTALQDIANPVMAFCQEDQDVQAVLTGMQTHRQAELLVRNETGEVVGTVSLEDIVKACSLPGSGAAQPLEVATTG